MQSGRHRTQRRVLALALLLWSLIGTYLALLPDPPGGVFGSHQRHMLFAAVLAFGIGAYAPSLLRPRSAAIVVLVSILPSMVVELAQSFDSVGRRVEVRDLVDNTVGVAIGLALSFLAHRVAPTSRRAVGLVVVCSSTVIAGVGSVRPSAPVSRWLACRTDREPAAEVVRTLDRRTDGVPFKKRGADVPTAFGPGRSTDTRADDLVHEIRCRERFAASFTARPTSVEQTGPRRIVALSAGTSTAQQLLVVGIQGTDLVTRVRFRPQSFETFTVPAVFAANEPRSIVLTYRSGVLGLTVDGRLRWSARPPRATLANWSRGYPLHVGNEATGDRRFEGEITDLTISA